MKTKLAQQIENEDRLCDDWKHIVSLLFLESLLSQQIKFEDGSEVEVRCEIANLSFSAHADAAGIVGWELVYCEQLSIFHSSPILARTSSLCLSRCGLSTGVIPLPWSLCMARPRR